MRVSRAFLLSIASLLVATVSAAPVTAGTAASAPPAEAFGAVPWRRDVVISPSGSMLAWVQTDGAEEHVVMFDLAAQKIKRTLGVGPGNKARGLHWVDDETLLAETSIMRQLPNGRRLDYYRYLATDASGGGARQLLGSDRNVQFTTGERLLSVRPANPKAVYLSTLENDWSKERMETGSHLENRRRDMGVVYTLFEVDTTTGNGKIVARGTQFTNSWVVDRNGKVLARSDWDGSQQHYRLLAAEGLSWREIYSENGGHPPRPIGPTADGKAVWVIGSMGHAHAALASIPLDGSAPSFLVEDPERNVVGVTYDQETMQPIAAFLDGKGSSIRWLDAAAGARYQTVTKAFHGSLIRNYRESQNHKKALALVSEGTRPPIYYLVDFTTGKADIVGEEYPDLTNAALGEVSKITYDARDGVSIPAFLILPPNSTGKNLPLVVVPHSAVNGYDDDQFDWFAQFLATRGYAVLQPQFRGSSGYGVEFEKAGERQWGGLMQDDITDGVKALISKGIVDSRRVCIVGDSYGGYAALAGATFTPDLYACAASINGISDLPLLLSYEEFEDIRGKESDRAEYWTKSIGAKTDPNVIARSPARAAAAVKVPILLIHGTNDTVVPASQSEAMANALKSAGKQFTFVKIPGEDHWLSQSETRIRVLKELDTFLAANLKAH